MLSRLRFQSLRVGALALTLIAWPSLAKAQIPQNVIHLYSPEKTYQPGRAVTLYVYFFRLADPMPFFRSWDEALQSTSSLQIIQKSRLSALSERIMEASGFPEDRYHVLYRLRLMPLRDDPSLSYGPLQYRQAQSAVITWTKAQASGGPAEQIRFTMTPSTTQTQIGQAISLRVSIQCPTFLCSYGRFDQADLSQYLQKNLRLAASPLLWFEQTHVSPTIAEDTSTTPSKMILQWDFTMYPLQAGTIPPLQAQIELPILETMDDGAAVRQILAWLQTQGISGFQASRLLRLQSEQAALSSRLLVKATSPALVSRPIQGCPGTWALSSRLVRLEGHPTPLWEIRLTGKGLFLLAKDAFQTAVETSLASVQDKLSLIHSLWKLPDAQASGRSEIALYFAYPPSWASLPPITMAFSLPSGGSETRSTPALAASTPVIRLSDTTQILASERRIYLLSQEPLSSQTDTTLRSFGYQIPEGFPSQAVLTQGLAVTGALSFTRERKMKDIVRRHTNQRGGFGMFIQINSQTQPIHVESASFQARLATGLFSRWPIVEWGGQRFGVYPLTDRGFSMAAKLSHDRLLVGESVEYTLTLQCPSNDCPPQTSTFYKQIFKPSLTLPPFDQYSQFRLLDDLTRRDLPDGTAVFVYRVRFKATQSGPLRLPAATLRLSSDLLQEIHQKHRICLFRGGGIDDRLLDAIVRDHLDQQSDPQCSLGTQEITAAALEATVSPLPATAAGIQLIGVYRLAARLTELAYPGKQASVTDKPFFLIVDIGGSGDLQAAREILRDQLDRLGQQMRRQGVTTYTETARDTDDSQAKLQIQLQMIPEQAGTITIPSLSLRYYHRDEGVLTAQTLPLSVTIEHRDGRRLSGPSTVTETAKPKPSESLLQETELRPIQILAAQDLPNEAFFLRAFPPLAFLFSSPLFFLLFFGWHRLERRRAADPLRQTQEAALGRVRKEIAKLDLSRPDAPRLLFASLQKYLAQRLRNPGLQMTTEEARQGLSSILPSLPPSALSLLKTMKTLEDALYGGGTIAESGALVRSLDTDLQALDRALPLSLPVSLSLSSTKEAG